MSKNKKVLILLIFIATFFCLSLDNVNAAAKDNKNKLHCILCNGDKETYKQEQQFMERIKIIKSVLGRKVDEVALAATVLHKENYYQAIASRYDDNFKENKKAYRQSFVDTFTNKKSALARGMSVSNNMTADDKERAKKVQAGAQVDLLNAAAIIMADSAGWTGSYNEAKYQKALAGDKLVGNNNGFGNDAYNAVFCATGGMLDTVFSTENITFQFLTGQDVLTEAERTSQRFYNMSKICANGYVAGVYDITPETEPNAEIRQAKKEAIAKEIIDLIHYYKLLTGSDEVCTVTTTGDFTTWKQADPEWGSIPIGNSNVANIGCLVTSIAMQIARSGTAITNLPSGYSVFNPGAFVTTLNNNNGFYGGGDFTWTGFGSLAANWKIGDSVSVSTNNKSTLVQKLSQELNSAAEGKYQKFLVLQIHHNSSTQHWVAVDSVTDNEVTILDPGGPTGNTLDDNYNGWVVDSYRVMYATDVDFGKTGTSTSNDEKCDGDVIHQVMEFVRKGEGAAYCNYKGQGPETGYEAYVDSADMSYVGWTTGYGFTQLYTQEYAAAVGYTTFLEDGSNGCTSREYVDKMAEKKFSENYEYISKLWTESGGGSISDHQYVALIYKYNHWPAIMPTLIGEITKVDSHSYEAFSIFMKYNGLGGSCGGYNGSELIYHVWYNGNYDAVRDYPCADPSVGYWQNRVALYNSEK